MIKMTEINNCDDIAIEQCQKCNHEMNFVINRKNFIKFKNKRKNKKREVRLPNVVLDNRGAVVVGID